MKTPEEVIKGLEYLSDEDKKRILEARGIEQAEPSPRQQAKADRETARKVEEQNFMQRAATDAIRYLATDTTPQKTPAANNMKLHINIQSYGKNGDEFHLEGDVFSQDDLAAIHDRFKDYMPRRKWWGIF